MRLRMLGLLAAALALLVSNSTARADFNSASYNWGDSLRSGTVDFARNGGNLVVTLTYSNFTGGSYGNIDMLSGVFFNLTGAGSLTGVSAWSGLGNSPAIFDRTGSSHYNGNPYVTNGSGQVQLSGEWAWGANVHGFNYGSAGVGYSPLFGGGNLYDINNAHPEWRYSNSSPPDGGDFQLGASNYVADTGPNNISFTVNTSIVLTFSGLSGSFDFGTGISGQVQFGTGFEEPHYDFGPSTPAPAGIVLLGLGGALTGLYSWRKRRQPKIA